MLENAVNGAPHSDLGVTVVGVIIAENGAGPDLDGIRAAMARSLARRKLPKRLELVTELLRNTMGKVQKNLLRDRLSGIFD